MTRCDERIGELQCTLEQDGHHAHHFESDLPEFVSKLVEYHVQQLELATRRARRMYWVWVSLSVVYFVVLLFTVLL